MGKAGRKALSELLPRARENYEPDIVLVNGENAAGGFGLTPIIFNYFHNDLHVDCVTSGNHWFDKREILDLTREHRCLLAPANMGNVSSHSWGFTVLESQRGIE